MSVQVQVIKTPHRERFLSECLDSMHLEPIEVVLTDFGHHLTNRLDFIDTATADFISFVDDDDVIVPGIFQKLLDVMTDDAVGAHSHEALITVDGKPLSPPNFNHAFSVERALIEYHFPRVALLRTEVAKEVSRFIRNQAPETWQYLYPEHVVLVLAGLVGGWVELPEVGYLYRQHAGNIKHSMPHSYLQVGTKNLVLGAQEELRKAREREVPDLLRL